MTLVRADAARNRERVLDAARAAHHEHGAGLAMHDVARRAGVGVGTVYRHFPTREALIDAVAHGFFADAVELARSVEQAHRPGDRFAAFVRAYAAALAERGVTGHCTWDAPAAEPVRAELRALLDGFVADGRAAGTLRADLTREDAGALIWTVVRLVDASAAGAPEVWRRHLELVLDAVGGGPPGRLAAPPVDPATWNRFVRGR